MGWWRPREVSGPPASPTRVGGATRPLRCPLRGRIESLAPGARGLGWQKSGPVKVFCPAFLQKAGGVQGPRPWPRAAARGTLLMLKKRRRGSKGGTLAGGSPFAGGLSRRRPSDLRTPTVIRRRAGIEPRPYGACGTWWGRRWTKERVVGDADPYGGWETGRMPHNMPRNHHTPGRGSAERGEAGVDREGGTSRTPSPTGRLRRRGAGVRLAPGGGGWPLWGFGLYTIFMRFTGQMPD